MKFWNFVKNEGDESGVELRIDGDIRMEEDFWDMLFGIEGFTAKGFMAELKNYSGKDITVWINSYGGDVYAASCIYTALKEHKGNVTCKIDGVAMSAASVIAMAAKDLCMSPTAIMMIHNPWIGGIQGESKDLRKYANMLDEVKATIMSAYQLKTGKSEEEISAMMDEETYMGAKKALAEGFIDKILYDDNQSDDQVNAFSFSMVKVHNTLSNSTKEFLSEYIKRSKNLKTSKNEGSSASCICETCNHSDNCQSSGASCCVCSDCSLASQCSKPGNNGCRCNQCTMAETNCCQPGSDSCLCANCPNTDCKRGNMGESSMTKDDSSMNLAKLLLNIERRKKLWT